MDKVKYSLEAKLEAMRRRPGMPPDLEARVRQRLLSATVHPAPRRKMRAAMLVQVLVLFGLLLMAGWVIGNRVVPILRAAWERTHCDPQK